MKRFIHLFSLFYTIVQMFGVSKIFKMFLKEVYCVYHACIYKIQ